MLLSAQWAAVLKWSSPQRLCELAAWKIMVEPTPKASKINCPLDLSTSF
jgi:hypothetical protein